MIRKKTPVKTVSSQTAKLSIATVTSETATAPVRKRIFPHPDLPLFKILDMRAVLK